MAYLDSDFDRQKKEKWSWKGKRKTPSIIQKKKMLARAMEVAVRTILSNHLYQFDGRVYKQQSGGPIGLEITGVLARCAMLWWDRAYLRKLKQLEIDLMLYLRYVDDTDMVLEALPPGPRFVNNELTIHLEAIQEDETKPPDETTAIVLRSIANSIMLMINMEEDFPSNHPSGKLPILDLEVWIEDGEVRHHFYKKRMANRKLVQAKSAFSVAI